ncbi:hypothetical protein MWU57_15375 [Isoptericola sp. S6320L]|uniref:hypothetical protein n=1 Tax=Isoptericola sp. S6320L TaxID=2926411 RepID=UPI001FF1302E|nr:hypothetical protein [Isoptericola sp. S6320L]MCK0118413.1 hypothetical protein [Isoptericola sp. S6320L]
MSSSRRVGAYVLPGDPTWLERTLSVYYPLLDDLVVPVPQDGRGWTGRPLPVDECVDIVRTVDTRGIARFVRGSWIDPQDPLGAETRQRQAAVDAMPDVDWVVQLDGDELLPSPGPLVHAMDRADARDVDAVELPMRVVFRRTRRARFEVVRPDGAPHLEYPGPVLVRPSVPLTSTRRTGGEFLRLIVPGDTSLQSARAPEPGEIREELPAQFESIVHNSWGRSPREILAKVRSWGHANDIRRYRYYVAVWLPTPATWRLLRNFHPLVSELWPRLRRVAD